MDTRVEEAFELAAPNGSAAGVFVLVEHASERLPDAWSWPEGDRRLVGTHWAYDLGAADLAREYAAHVGAGLLLSRFSRLLIDPNRALDSGTLYRDVADGLPVHLNVGITEDDQRRRVEDYWKPYHAVADEQIASSRASVLLAVHTFTPVYEGEPRSLEIGVLYDTDPRLAERVAEHISRAGLAVGLNEPWSGLAGMMYSADWHAHQHGIEAVEVEVRQDLSVDPGFRKDFIELLASILR